MPKVELKWELVPRNLEEKQKQRWGFQLAGAQAAGLEQTDTLGE
jgi:hypothetical protein